MPFVLRQDVFRREEKAFKWMQNLRFASTSESIRSEGLHISWNQSKAGSLSPASAVTNKDLFKIRALTCVHPRDYHVELDHCDRVFKMLV